MGATPELVERICEGVRFPFNLDGFAITAGGLPNRRRVTEDLAVKLNRRRRGYFNRRRMSLDQ